MREDTSLALRPLRIKGHTCCRKLSNHSGLTCLSNSRPGRHSLSFEQREAELLDSFLCKNLWPAESKKLPAIPQGDNLKAVLFDIDGTIADSDPIHFQAFQEILVEAGYNNGVPITHDFFVRQMSGKLNYVIAGELMPEMEEDKRIQFMDKKEARFRSLAATDVKPISGFHQFVEWVKKRGLRRAAVTNTPRENAELILKTLGVADFFEILVVGNECERPKPFPDPYLQAIKHLGIEPNEAFVLEDSPSGVKAGVAAGSAAVGMLTGHPGPLLVSSVLIDDYNDPALWDALGYPSDKPSPPARPPALDNPPTPENTTPLVQVVA